jgi:hypothetical protein
VLLDVKKVCDKHGREAVSSAITFLDQLSWFILLPMALEKIGPLATSRL